MYRIILFGTITAIFLIMSCSDNGTSSSITFESTWKRVIVDSSGTFIGDALQAAEGSFYVLVNYQQSEGAERTIRILKVDSEADIIDTIDIAANPGTGSLNASSFTQANNGDFLITGQIYDGDTQFMTVRAGISGTVLNDTSFGGANNEYAYDIIGTSDGGGAAIGWTSSLGGVSAAFYMCRLDENGEITAVKTYTSGIESTGSSIVEAPADGFVMVGTTRHSSGDHNDILAIAVNSVGETNWAKQLGGTGNDFGKNILAVPGGYLIGGITGSFGAGGYDLYLSKLDYNGEILWENAYGTSAYENLECITTTSDGSYLLLGSVSGSTVGTALYKISSDGTVIWNTIIEDSLDIMKSAFEISGTAVAVFGQDENIDGTFTGYMELITIDGL